MRISKFTSKDALIEEIKNNTYFESFEVSKLVGENGAVFQIRTQSRVTLKDLSVLGLLDKNVYLVASDKREILLTWLEN